MTAAETTFMQLSVAMRLVILTGLQESIISGSDAEAQRAAEVLLELDYPYTAETARAVRSRRLAAA